MTGKPEPTAAATDLPIRIELGHAVVNHDELHKLGAGAVVALCELVDDPVRIFDSGRPVAEGQIVLLDEKFCVRVTRLIEARSATLP